MARKIGYTSLTSIIQRQEKKKASVLSKVIQEIKIIYEFHQFYTYGNSIY